MEKLGALIQLVGASLSFFFLFLILSKRKKEHNDYILSAVFFIYFATLILSYTDSFNRNNGYPYPSLLNTSVPLILLHAPLIWLYIKSLTTPKFSFRLSYLVHFMPFLVAFITMVATFYLLPSTQKVLVDSRALFVESFTFPMLVLLIALTNIVYYLWGLMLISRYQKLIQSYFSEINAIDLGWLMFLIKATLASYLVISLLYLLNYFTGILSYEMLQSLGYSLGAFYVVALGFFGLRQTNIFVDSTAVISIEAVEKLPIPSTSISKADAIFVEQLLLFMNKSKPFLDSDLTIAKLAELQNVPTDYLSNILNSSLGMNFYDFINRYRVEEFKKKCNEPQSSLFTLIGMAYDCGFNSKPTFNRVFKKETGLTPGQYYDSIVRQKSEL